MPKDLQPYPLASEKSMLFADDGVEVSLRFDPEEQSIWGTYQNIADLFGVDVSVAKKHVKNVYADEELDKTATSAKFALVQIEGGRPAHREGILHFSDHASMSKKASTFGPPASAAEIRAIGLLQAKKNRQVAVAGRAADLD